MKNFQLLLKEVSSESRDHFVASAVFLRDSSRLILREPVDEKKVIPCAVQVKMKAIRYHDPLVPHLHDKKNSHRFHVRVCFYYPRGGGALGARASIICKKLRGISAQKPINQRLC